MYVRTLAGLALAAAIVNGCSGSDGTNVAAGSSGSSGSSGQVDPGGAGGPDGSAPDPATGDDAGGDAWTTPPPPPDPGTCSDELRYIPTGAAQWQVVCGRGNGDMIS